MLCSQRLAAVTLHRIVHLFDENGELKDKFSTKPADPKVPNASVQSSKLMFLAGVIVLTVN